MNQPEEQRALVSWKEIASFLNRAERTVRRWEAERGLPVHRVPGGERGRVFAYPSELKAWLVSDPMASATAAEDEADEEEADLAIGPAEPDQMASAIRAEAQARPFPEPLEGEPDRPWVSSRHWTGWGIVGALLLVLGTGVLAFRGSTGHARQEPSTAPAASESLRHTPEARAEELYLQGRYQWALRTSESLAKSVDDYTQAIVADPADAEAYAALAESYELLPDFGTTNRGEAYSRAEAAADRAIELEPSLAAGHRAKAFVLFYGDWDVARSDAEFQRALALDPNEVSTHHWYAGTLLSRLEGAKSMAQIDEALRLSPTSPAVVADAAFIHGFFQDNRQEDIRTLRDLVKTQPNLVMSSRYLAVFDLDDGDYSDYVANLRTAAAISHNPDETALAQAAAQGWARAGKAGMLEGMRQAQRAAFERGTASGYTLGRTYLLLGQPKTALRYFRAAFERNDFTVMTLSGCECISGVKNDPEYISLFRQIRARMRLPPVSQASLGEAGERGAPQTSVSKPRSLP